MMQRAAHRCSELHIKGPMLNSPLIKPTFIVRRHSPPIPQEPMPGTVNIQVVNDLTSAAAATVSRAGDERGHARDLAGGFGRQGPRAGAGPRSRARQLYLARELVVLDAAEFLVEA
jgi:hypothetical protein